MDTLPIPEPSRELKTKFRWLQLTLKNETQFSGRPSATCFDAGRYWDAPAAIAPFTQSTWSACSGDISVATGAAGGAVFHFEFGGAQMDVALVRSFPPHCRPRS